MTLRVGIMGAGAIGCFLGGMLRAHDTEVVFVGRGRTKSDVERWGLTLVDMRGARVSVPPERIVIDSNVHVLAPCNVVLCCVKSAQTEDSARALADVLSPDAVVVSMQNGIGNADALRRWLGERCVLGGVVGFNVICENHSVFRQATTGPLVIEASTSPLVGELARKLDACGLEVELASDIRGVQWAKLVMNLNNAVSAISGAPSADLLFVPGYRRIVRALVTESIEVMKRAGIRTAKLGPMPVSWFPRLLGLPSPLLRAIARIQFKIDPNARSSMWEDLSRGRMTEVDYLNGEVVKLAETSGSDAPLNRRLVELVHEVERAGRGSPKLSPEAFWNALTA